MLVSDDEQEESLRFVGVGSLSPNRMMTLISFGSYVPNLNFDVFITLQRINDLSRSYCSWRRPLEFWDYADHLLALLDDINSETSDQNPKVYVAERFSDPIASQGSVLSDRRYSEYYLRCRVRNCNSNTLDTSSDDDLLIPQSLKRYELRQFRIGTTRGLSATWLVHNDGRSTGRLHHTSFPPETNRRAIRAYQIFSGHLTHHNLLTSTFDDSGNVRLEYLGILSRSAFGMIVHQSTFIMKGVLLVPNATEESCNCGTCRLHRYRMERIYYGVGDREYTVYEEFSGIGFDEHSFA